jgi:hypothetical protein
MAFNLDEVNERIRRSKEFLSAVTTKLAEVKKRLKDNELIVAETPEEYWNENPLELLKMNKAMEDDVSLLGLLKEETTKTFNKAEEDLVQIFYELRKELGDV